MSFQSGQCDGRAARDTRRVALLLTRYLQDAPAIESRLSSVRDSLLQLASGHEDLATAKSMLMAAPVRDPECHCELLRLDLIQELDELLD